MVNQRSDLNNSRVYHNNKTRKVSSTSNSSLSNSSSSSASDSSSDRENSSLKLRKNLSRQERNRISAVESRLKKERLIQELTIQAEHLENENNFLQSLLTEVINLQNSTISNEYHSTKEQAMFY